MFFDPKTIPATRQLPGEILPEVMAEASRMLHYTPRIGILGKTGVGKSTLCNALFGADTCPVSDVVACTRAAQEVNLEMKDGKRIILVDVPGVGENRSRDEEYAALYERLLPELDLVLWVIKADDRAWSVDLDFYVHVVKPHLEAGLPLLFVLNQVDKVEPFREWDMRNGQPGPRQQKHIDLKIEQIAQAFGVTPARVIATSSVEAYGLDTLVQSMIDVLPDEKRLATFRTVKARFRSEAAAEKTRRSVKAVLMHAAETAARGAAVGAAIGERFVPAGAKLGAIIGTIAGAIVGAAGLW